MKPEQLRDLMRYRLEQAHETLREAILLRDVSDGRMNTSPGYQALLLAQARQLPDGGWEVRAGMPRVAGEGETWTIDVACFASRYVLLDLKAEP